VPRKIWQTWNGLRQATPKRSLTCFTIQLFKDFGNSRRDVAPHWQENKWKHKDPLFPSTGWKFRRSRFTVVLRSIKSIHNLDRILVSSLGQFFLPLCMEMLSA
jgi:hypothetical protein